MNRCNFGGTPGGRYEHHKPRIPTHIVVSQAEVRLVADETANAGTSTIKSDQQRVEAAQEVEAAEAKANVDFVT